MLLFNNVNTLEILKFRQYQNITSVVMFYKQGLSP